MIVAYDVDCMYDMHGMYVRHAWYVRCVRCVLHVLYVRYQQRPVLMYTGIPRSRNWISVFEGNPIGFPPSPIGMAGNFKSLLFS